MFPTPRRLATISALALVTGLAVISSARAVVFDWVTTSDSASSGTTAGFGAAARDGGAATVTGFYTGTNVVLGDGVQRTSGNSGLNRSGFTQAIDATGAVAWTTTATAPGSGGAAGNVAAIALSPLSDGDTVVTGYFNGSNVDLGDGTPRTSGNGGASNSAFTLRVRSDGSVAWTTAATAPGSSPSLAQGVGAIPDGRSVVTGYFTGTVDLGDGVTRTSPGSGAYQAMFTQMLSAGGAVQWTTVSSAVGSSSVTPQGATALPDGRAIVTGFFRGTAVDLGDGVSRRSANGGADNSSYVAWFRPDGTVMRVRTSSAAGASDTRAYDVSSTPSGAAIVTGFFRGADVDLGDGVPRTTANGGASGNGSMFTQQLRADGTVAWTTVSSSPDGPQSFAQGNGVSARPDGSAFVTGLLYGTDVDLGDGVPRPSPAGAYTLVNMVLGADGLVAWVTTSSGPVLGNTRGMAASALPDGWAVATGYFQGSGIDFGDGVARTSANGGLGNSAFTQMLLAPPAAPDAPTVTISGDAATVTIAPLGSAITGYTVTASPGGRTCTITPPATSCVITGLQSGVAHSFSARARNAAGEGAASPAAEATPPLRAAQAATSRHALVVTLLPQRTRLRSGESTRIGIRTRNQGDATAPGVTSCMRLPSNLVIGAGGSSVRSGRTLCFRIGDLLAGRTATRSVMVRAVATRAVTRRVTGSTRSTDAPADRTAARPVLLRIAPRPARARVTG